MFSVSKKTKIIEQNRVQKNYDMPILRNQQSIFDLIILGLNAMCNLTQSSSPSPFSQNRRRGARVG
jgi:hypothetical protein